jgi:hypothetical protein
MRSLASFNSGENATVLSEAFCTWPRQKLPLGTGAHPILRIWQLLGVLVKTWLGDPTDLLVRKVEKEPQIDGKV